MRTSEDTTLSILGRTAAGPLVADQIEVWDLPARVLVTYETGELSALCPVTGQPDIYSASISYAADKTLESKGLKHYLWSFRDQGISAEVLAITIATDLSARLGEDVSVDLTQQVRGGLSLTASHTASGGQR